MRKWLAGIVLFLSIVLLSISIYFLMGMYQQEKKDDRTYQKISDLYENEDFDGTEEPETTEEESINAGLIALHRENEDCIGWIKIEGTAIDYPVMYRPQEKNYYLHRDFYGEYSANGSLFLAEECVPGISDNLIIYGHHMNSGKMFAVLDEYKSFEFYQEHSMICYSTLYGDEKYQIIAAFATPVYTGSDFAYYGFIQAKDKNEYEEFIRACKSRSFYDTGLQAHFGDKLLTLSTCEYSHKNGRMVVVAKKVEE